MQLFRHIPYACPAPGIYIRGPLRILVVLACPDTGPGVGPLLDVEAG